MNVSCVQLKPLHLTPIPELVRLRTKARKKLIYQKQTIDLLLYILRSRKENLVIKDGGVKDVLLQATKYIETNITDSKVATTKIFLSLVFDNDIQKISTIEEKEYTEYIVESIMNMQMTPHAAARFQESQSKWQVARYFIRLHSKQQ